MREQAVYRPLSLCIFGLTWALASFPNAVQASPAGALFKSPGVYRLEGRVESGSTLFRLNRGSDREVEIRLARTPSDPLLPDLVMEACLEIARGCDLRCEGKLIRVVYLIPPPKGARTYAQPLEPLPRGACTDPKNASAR